MDRSNEGKGRARAGHRASRSRHDRTVALPAHGKRGARPDGRPRLLLMALGSQAAALAGGIDALGAPTGIACDVEIVLHAWPHLPSASLSPAHLVEVAHRIEQALAEDCDGAVVAQGADTVEESAFVLDLLVPGSKPVVVTAAGAGPATTGDARGQLLTAMRVAGCREARDLGTLVLAGDRIHAARFAQRVRTGPSPELLSPLVGPIGTVVEGRPRFWVRVTRLPVLPFHGGPPRAVALLSWTMGEDGRRLGALPTLGYDGAVVEGMGAGYVPIEAVPPLCELAARMPVVLASRAPDGVVVARGGGTGMAEDEAGDTDLLRHGLIPAGCLTGLKARLLLGLALRGGAGHAAVAAAFSPYQ